MWPLGEVTKRGGVAEGGGQLVGVCGAAVDEDDALVGLPEGGEVVTERVVVYAFAPANFNDDHTFSDLRLPIYGCRFTIADL